MVVPMERLLSFLDPSVRIGDASRQSALRATFGVNFVNVAKESGLKAATIFGGAHKNKYLLETTGCGVAFYDYDNDGWLDIFLVNGTRLEGFPPGQAPTNRLFKNNRDGTFTDVTAKAGLAHSGWGQGVCIGDYDNDGYEDLFVAYFGKNALYHNNGDGTFTDVTERAGVAGNGKRWNSGCAFVDYDRDGKLDLFVANYIDLDLATAAVPESGPCLYKGVMVACGPPGLNGGKNILFRNNGDGTFTDVSQNSGILEANGTYGLGVLTGDFDNDGWPDIYVANDSAPSALYQNQKNGKFVDIALEAGCALSADGKPQAGMGVSAADYDLDGNLDIVKTNFAGDTPSLYHNLGGATFEDATFPAGLGKHTQYLGWGTTFFDFDNDGWPDLLVVNGHVYPEVDKQHLGSTYPEPRILYRNNRNGTFSDISVEAGPGITAMHAGRGLAVGDLWNDGRLSAVISNMNDHPSLLVNQVHSANHWIGIRTIGTKSNRDGIGARITVKAGARTLVDEVRSGASYASNNDMRVHFGLGASVKIDWVQIRWPSGLSERFDDLGVDKIHTIKEGSGKSAEAEARPSGGRRSQ